MSLESPELTIGATVKMMRLPPYLKTVEPSPMLRPAQLVSLEERGIVLEQRPEERWVVQFPRGTFVIDRQYLEIDPPPAIISTSAN
jgi:Protein of unknown function (DUF3148)